MSETRSLPADVSSERAVIGQAILRQEICAEQHDLRPHDFSLTHHVDVWTVMLAVHASGRPLDPLVVADELRREGVRLGNEGGPETYLLECANAVPTAANVAHYASLVREASRQRRVIAVCSEIAAQAYQRASSDALLSQARDRFADLENTGSGDGPVRVGDELDSVIAGIAARGKNSDSYFVRTGIGKFDHFFGGLRPEKLIVVAGPPGMGKSAWAGTVAPHNALRGIPSLIISLEMGREELIERFLAGHARVANQEIASGVIAQPLVNGDEREGWRAVKHAAKTLWPVPLFVDDREALTLSQLVGTIRRWYAKTLGAVPIKPEPPKLGFVAIDYLQLLSPDKEDESETRAQEVGRMTRALKRLSKSLRIPIALLSQLNRAWAKRADAQPILSDLRDSGAIEQDADVVIFPWRKQRRDDEGNDVRESASGPAEWIVAKNRGGPTGSIPVHWTAESTRFDDVDDRR